MITELKKYLADFSENYKITILTLQDASKIFEWFIDKKLFKFVDVISNPTYKN